MHPQATEINKKNSCLSTQDHFCQTKIQKRLEQSAGKARGILEGAQRRVAAPRVQAQLLRRVHRQPVHRLCTDERRNGGPGCLVNPVTPGGFLGQKQVFLLQKKGPGTRNSKLASLFGMGKTSACRLHTTGLTVSPSREVVTCSQNNFIAKNGARFIVLPHKKKHFFCFT